jgi:glycosyltransferase involved in cell wall biosynthesis
LFVDKNFPNPNSNAAGYAIIQEIKIFQELGFDITFISLNDSNSNSNDYETFRSLNIRIISFPFAYNVNDFIATNGNFFDLFYLTRFNVAEVVINQIKSLNLNTKIILNLADLHYLREKRCATILNDENLLKISLEIKKRELEIIKIVDLVLTYSIDERNILSDEEKISSYLELCPWVQEVSNNHTEFDSSTDLVFLGGFQHFPNEDGILWFINNVMPILRSRKLGIKLNIYGYGISEKILKYQSNDVIIKGYAHSLDQVFMNTKIFVAPLRFGAGIKGKVLAAFAYGIPVIMSAVAAEAIPIKDLMNQNLVAYDEQDWARKIEKLYFDRVLWNEITNMEKILIKNNYSFIEAVQKMKVILEKLV